MINHMREQGAKFNTPYVQIGVIVSPEPLTIKLGDLQIGKENLLIADHLMPGYARNYSATGDLLFTDSGTLGGTDLATISTHGSHSHTVTDLNIASNTATQRGDFLFLDGFKTEDIVALIPTLDGQTYIVLAKVVRP